uniref:Uncharacterized protein n=1 Tax=Timema tahoe TaxID=61484 RepID=A0A7R9IKL3_9NEOP|nr:unnamed protein product [Timema tahoe]
MYIAHAFEPKDVSKTSSTRYEAIDMFEELARVAKWELMMARVNCYKERSSKRAKRAGSPVPCVELYDTSNKQDINIAEELVKHGFAVWEEEKDTILTSPHKPISGHQAEGPSTHSSLDTSSLELNGHSKTPLHMESVVSPSEDKTGMFSMKD